MTAEYLFFEPGKHKDHGLTYNPLKALIAPLVDEAPAHLECRADWHAG